MNEFRRAGAVDVRFHEVEVRALSYQKCVVHHSDWVIPSRCSVGALARVRRAGCALENAPAKSSVAVGFIQGVMLMLPMSLTRRKVKVPEVVSGCLCAPVSVSA